MGLKKKLTPNKVAEQVLAAKKRAAVKRKSEPKKPIKKEEPKKKEPPVRVNKPTDFIRIAENATKEERDKISKMILKGEVTMGFYGIDGKIGYHYYRKIKKGK
jgi:hypothetical protein